MRAHVTNEQLSRDIKDGLTVHEIVSKYGYKDVTAVYYRCKRNNIPKPRVAPHKRPDYCVKFNTRFFKTITTEEQAYTVGFIGADGSRDRDWGIKISLHPRDTDILEKIAAAVGHSRGPRLVENDTRIMLSLYDTTMVKDLERYGIVPRKTSTLPFAPNIPDDMLYHYMRGMMDGDGSIGRQCRFVTGSKPFFDGLLDWYGKTYNRLPWTRKEGNKWRVVFNRCDADFINAMYANATISLDRKLALYKLNWT